MLEASVKVMLSYDYCHFEVALSNDNKMTLKKVNEMRKDAQRLADEAVRQYKVAKEMASKRQLAIYEKGKFIEKIKEIQSKPEGERTINEVAMLKQYKDEKWKEQFDFGYDYEDDSF